MPDKEGLPKTDLNKELVKDEPTEVDHAKEDSVTQEPAIEEISAVVSENIITQISQMRKQILLRVNQQN